MFKTVFAHAQARLKSTFGLEMVELMSRAEHRRKQDEADLDKMLTGLKKKGGAHTELFAPAAYFEIQRLFLVLKPTFYDPFYTPHLLMQLQLPIKIFSKKRWRMLVMTTMNCRVHTVVSSAGAHLINSEHLDFYTSSLHSFS